MASAVRWPLDGPAGGTPALAAGGTPALAAGGSEAVVDGERRNSGEGATKPAARRLPVSRPGSGRRSLPTGASVGVLEVVPDAVGDDVGCLLVGGCVVESFDEFGG